MAYLTSLRIIGLQSAKRLEAVGIHTPEQLFDMGVVQAYLRVKAAYPERVSRNRLFAMQGALMDISWNELPSEIKTSLIKQIEDDAW